MKKTILICLLCLALLPGVVEAQKYLQKYYTDSVGGWSLSASVPAGSKKDTTVLFQGFLGDKGVEEIMPIIGMATAGVDSALYVYYYWGFFGSDWEALTRVDTLVHAGSYKYINSNATAATVYSQKWMPIDSIGPWLKITAVGTADAGGDTASNLKFHTELYTWGQRERYALYDTGQATCDFAVAADAHDTTVLFTKKIENYGITKFTIATYLASGSSNIDSLLRVVYQSSNSGATGTWQSLTIQDTLWATGVDSTTYGYLGIAGAWYPYDSVGAYVRALAILEGDHKDGDTGQVEIKYSIIGLDERCAPRNRNWDYSYENYLSHSYSLAGSARDSFDLFTVDIAKEGLMSFCPEIYMDQLGAVDSFVMVRYYRSADSLNWTALAELDTIFETGADTSRLSTLAGKWLSMDSTGRYFKAEAVTQADKTGGDSSSFGLKISNKGISEKCKEF